MKNALLAIILLTSTGCLIKPEWKPVTNVSDTKSEIFQLSEQEWAAAKEFQATLGELSTSKDDLLTVAGVLYGIAEVLKSDTRFIYNVQVDEFRVAAISTALNGKNIDSMIPGFLGKVKGKFAYLTPGDAKLADDNKAKAISQFKILAGGVYLSAQGK